MTKAELEAQAVEMRETVAALIQQVTALKEQREYLYKGLAALTLEVFEYDGALRKNLQGTVNKRESICWADLKAMATDANQMVIILKEEIET